MQVAIKITNLSAANLVAYHKNARTHSLEQIAKISSSIKEFGFINPVIVDGANGIIAGHGRVVAALALGMVKVPCIEVSHLTQAQKAAYVIADNRLAELSDWNIDMLLDETTSLMDMGFDIELSGIDTDFLNSLTMNIGYEPELNPSANTNQVSNQNVSEATIKLGEAFQQKAIQNLIEVICPACAEEFNIDPENLKNNA